MGFCGFLVKFNGYLMDFDMVLDFVFLDFEGFG